MRRLVIVFGAILFCATALFSQSATDKVLVGYAVVTPSTPITTGLVAFETINQTRSGDTLQVGVFASDLTLNGLLPVDISKKSSKTLGVAIANPNPGAANLTLTLRKTDGTQLTSTTINVPARQQISKIVTELFPTPSPGGFSAQTTIPDEFAGTLIINSTSPVSIVGLKFRGLNYSTIPLMDLTPANNPVPAIIQGVGGIGAILFPQFVTGGVWGTEITLTNTTASNLTVRVDIFDQTGAPLPVKLNNQTLSSFTNLSVPANGLLTLAP